MIEWSTACPDWERRIVAGESLIPFEPLFPREAKAAMDVFSELLLVDVAGAPSMHDVARDWLLQFVAHVFGGYDVDAGRRLINEFFLLISKKNSKSTTAAGIMLTALVRNWRRSAEFLIVAPTIEIANNSFGPARDMVANDPQLSDLLHVQDHFRTISHRLTKATLKIVAADNETVGGKKASGILIDELWLFGKREQAENMLREATGGLASRPEGFTIYLSTQSDEAPRGVFKSKLSYARDVRDGKIIDNKFLPVIYEYPEAMIKSKAYLKPENFYITNPNIDASVDREFLARELLKAQAAGEKSIRGFVSKHLNVEIGIALRSDCWSGAEFWEAAARPRMTFKQLLEWSEVVCMGIDGGGLDDMLGVAAVGRNDAGQLRLFARAWVHPIAIERNKHEATNWKDFQAEGDLIISENIGDDVRGVVALCKEAEDAGVLDNIGVDRVGIATIVDELMAAKFKQERIIGIPQGWKMVGAIKATERHLASGVLTHDGSLLMQYAVSNARIEARGNAILITKQISGACKIDPLMAALNAMTLMGENPKARKKKYQMMFV